MKIGFELDEHETKITPIKVADALIDCGQFDHKDLKEIIAYLSVHTKYNKPEDFPAGKRNVFGR